MRLRIECIIKTNRYDPHDRIHTIGGKYDSGTPWRMPQQEAISGILSGIYSFYVHVGTMTVDVIVATHLGHNYIKTRNDGLHPDNLLSLQSCV